MKTGRTLQELAIELDRQHKAKRDFLADTRELVMLNGSALVIGSADHAPLRTTIDGITDHAHGQLASYLHIPRDYYDRMRTTLPTLLDRNVNDWLRQRPDKRMVRTMDYDDGKGQVVRAFLSDRYRRLDNAELAEQILPIFRDMGDVEFPSMDVTPSKLYLKVVTPRLEAEVRKGDIIRGGLMISNSEIGQGALRIAPFVIRLVCVNGMVGEEMIGRRHVGRQVEESDEAAYELFTDETLRADDKAFWLKVRDVVKASFNEVRFQQVIRQLKLAADSDPLKDVSFGVKELGRRLDLDEGEQTSILNYLVQGGDLTRYGAVQAVTRAAEDAATYDRATDLEVAGGRLAAMQEHEWAALAAVAPESR